VFLWTNRILDQEMYVPLALLKSRHALIVQQTILSVPVKVNLNSGANTIVFGAGQSSYAGDLDKIIVYTAT
jgi:hypothetical protein